MHVHYNQIVAAAATCRNGCHFGIACVVQEVDVKFACQVSAHPPA